jgi:putative tryptophan/tyrosine transport system substrate-binding protein
MMRRREFIAVIIAVAVGLPHFVCAQQMGTKRIGVLMNKTADDAQGRGEVSAFETALQQRGWKTGQNVQIEYRFGGGDLNLYRKFATELVRLSPDLLFGVGGTVVGALQQATQTVPIVFVETTDPVSRGLVASLSRPGGNTTGFTQFEFGISGKWLELLKQIVPGLTRALIVRDPSEFSGVGELAAIQAIAPSLGVELTALDPRNTSEIGRVIADFAHHPNSGMVVTPSGTSIKHRKLIISLANQSRLPAIYAYSYFVTDGGLISYGPDEAEPYGLAAGYIDRILKGEQPSDLPVQAPTKIELAINLKTAKALGLTIPPSLLGAANIAIE